jgi:hypothetical protein
VESWNVGAGEVVRQAASAPPSVEFSLPIFWNLISAMSLEVAVPCPHCAFSQRVEFRRAGQTISCPSCGQPFTAPKLRELKQLVPDQPQATARKPIAAGQTPLRNWMFVIGLAAATLAGISGYFVSKYAKSLTIDEDLVEKYAFQVEKDLDNYPPEDLWITWETWLANRVLPPWELAVSRDDQLLGESMRYTGLALFGIAGLGVASLLGSFFLGKAPASSAGR